jgi:hypothetical protein
MYNSNWQICWGAGPKVDRPIEQYNVLCHDCCREDILARPLDAKARVKCGVQLRIHRDFRHYVWWAPGDGTFVPHFSHIASLNHYVI